MSPQHLRRTALILGLGLGACATTRTQLREQAWEDNPVAWPVGYFEVSGRVSFHNPYVPAGESRTLHETLVVEPGNVVTLCGETAVVKGDRTGFGCVDGSVALTTDGERIWGTITRTVSFRRPTGEMRCIQYRTEEDGTRTCVRWDRDQERTYRETAHGQVSVVVRG